MGTVKGTRTRGRARISGTSSSWLERGGERRNRADLRQVEEGKAKREGEDERGLAREDEGKDRRARDSRRRGRGT